VKFPRAQGTTQFNITLERKNAEFKDAISLYLDGLPPGFTSAVKADKDTHQVTLTGPKDAPASRHTFQVTAYGELKGSGQIMTLELPLEVSDSPTQ
jgi:hypothetical protein